MDKNSNPKTILTSLIKIKNDKKTLNSNDIVSLIIDFIIAGVDTVNFIFNLYIR